MPGTGFRGSLPPLTEPQSKLRDELRRDLEHLANDIGPRHLDRYEALEASAQFITREFTEAGYQPFRQEYQVRGRLCRNVIVEVPGRAKKDEIIVVAAHYDSVSGCPGANDNGSGTVALLALARRLANAEAERTLRFAAVVNEEAPYFQTDQMGSLQYARHCKQHRENIVGMLCLETVGYYSDAPGSQNYPPPLSSQYPTTGNFIGFVSNEASRELMNGMLTSFRKHAKFPSEGAALPDRLPGVGWSDHWSFWQMGYPAVMVTDTAFFRYPHYHRPSDTPDKIDFDRMARVVDGLQGVLKDLCRASSK